MTKVAAAVAALGWSCVAIAGGTGVAGTRLGGEYAAPAPAGSGVGFGALAQMTLALAIVAFLLKWVLPRIAGKVTKKFVTTSGGGIKVEETAQFAGGSLYIISARGKSLLISVSGANVTTLAELSAPTRSAEDPFEFALAEAQARPAPSAAELEARAALDRLSRLTVGHAR